MTIPISTEKGSRFSQSASDLVNSASSGSEFRVWLDIPEGDISAAASAASTILGCCEELGLDPAFGHALVTYAYAETRLIANATNPKTNAQGFFQMVPTAGWVSAGPSTSWEKVRSQVAEISRKVPKERQTQLDFLYAHLFYDVLGRHYGRYHVLGLRPLQTTFSQYVAVDDQGISFHSPLLIAIYAASLIVKDLGWDVNVTLPQVPQVLSLNKGASIAVLKPPFRLLKPGTERSAWSVIPSSALGLLTRNEIQELLTSDLDPSVESSVPDISSYPLGSEFFDSRISFSFDSGVPKNDRDFSLSVANFGLPAVVRDAFSDPSVKGSEGVLATSFDTLRHFIEFDGSSLAAMGTLIGFEASKVPGLGMMVVDQLTGKIVRNGAMTELAGLL